MSQLARIFTIAFTALAVGTAVHAAPPAHKTSALKEVAQSKVQWTGCAVSQDGRLFVNFPRWTQTIPMSVGELKNGVPSAFPNAEWNSWQSGEAPQNKFVCVQSVFVDANNRCWILDPASPNMKGIVNGGPKLVQVDLNTNKVVRVYPFDESVAPEKSYLNDVRIDLKNNNAVMTESGTGSIVVLDLATGKARRLLANHPSTKAEDITIYVNGKKFLRDGTQPKINADSMALDRQFRYLYYKALTGKTLYRAPLSAIEDPNLSDADLASKVETVAQVVPSDGMEIGLDDNLYITSIEDNSIRRLTVSQPKPQLEKVLGDSRLDWPDSFALAKDGHLFVTTSRINEGNKPSQPYGLFEFAP